MKSILTKLGCTAFLAASFAVSNQAIAAQDDAYNDNDVLLFFRNPAGTTGTDKVVYFSLGSSYGVFRQAATPGSGTAGTTIPLGNINTILSTTYGSDWTGAASTIFLGAVGQNAPTDAFDTSFENGDYARTVYVTKARTSVGTFGMKNSGSALYNTATQSAVPSQIAGANNISSMSQPGVISNTNTVIDAYNPITSGAAGTAYGVFSSGVMTKLGSQFTFGNITNVVAALDLYRVTRTTGENAADSSLWHIANPITASNTGTISQGSPREDFLGTIVITANGNVNFVAVGATGGAVTPAVPTITTPPTAASITYGQTLANATLSGGNASGVAGTFAFTAPSMAPAAGTTTYSVTFTPTDSGNYTTATTNVSVTVAKATPTITTQPLASAITSGQTLASSTLSGGLGSVAGAFAFTTPGTVPSVGAAQQSFTFTPTDSVNYDSVTGSVSVTVNAAAPTAPTITTPPTAASITYGQTLSNATLSGGNASGVAGTFAFTAPSTVPSAGTTTYSVTFTPTDSGNYTTATTNVSVTVAKATPTITTQPLASAITSGQTLASSTLSGGLGSVAGAFAFTTPGTIPSVGAAQQSFTFTPTDSVNYNSVTGSVLVTVSDAVTAPAITSATTANGTVGSVFTYTITASNNATSFNTSTPRPSWLTFNSTTGVLRGTPPASELIDIELTASNSAGTDSKTLQIKIGAESSVFQTIKFLGGASLPTGGEIVDYANGKVLTTNSGNGTHEVEIFTVSSTGAFTGSADSVDLSSVFDGASNISSVSSVLADSRGFGVATVIPTATAEGNVGRIAIFNIDTREIITTLNVGYHPDSVTITPDGTKLIVTNEGEYGSTNSTIAESYNRPGSISVVDISSVTTLAQVGNLTQSNVITYDFSSGNLASGVSITALRNPRLDTLTTKTPNSADIEPEYATATNSQVFVTLQENNAVAVFDFATSKYSAIYELGTIPQLIDASDSDGANNTTSIAINDSVQGLPMPDAIARFTRSGVGYLLTANEGDARPDDGDIARGSTLTANMSTEVAALATNTGIGRLQLLRYEGDTNNDGLIDMPTMMGTRSFTIWNSSNGMLVYDSGSTLEMFAAANDSESFNTNSGNLSNTDTRSDDKGPEPEAIAYASLGGRDYAFVGCERQNGIYAFDITDLSKVKVVGYFNTISSTQDSGADYISPESIKFIHAGTNPSGKNLLLVGYEGTGSNGSVAVFEFAPVGVSSGGQQQQTPQTTQSTAQKPLSSATTVAEVKAIVSARIQAALAQDPVKVKTVSQVAEVLGVSKSTLSKIAKLNPALKTADGKINIARLEKFISRNPKAAALLTGNSVKEGSSKKSSAKN